MHFRKNYAPNSAKKFFGLQLNERKDIFEIPLSVAGIHVVGYLSREKKTYMGQIAHGPLILGGVPKFYGEL